MLALSLSVCFSGEHSCWHCLTLTLFQWRVFMLALSLCFGVGGGLFVDKLTHLYLIICIIQQYSVCHCVYHRGDPVLMTGR